MKNKIAEMLKEFNKERRENKGKWVYFYGEVNGEEVAIKSFDTTIQILKYKGHKTGGPCDCSVKAMNEFVTTALGGMDY